MKNNEISHRLNEMLPRIGYITFIARCFVVTSIRSPCKVILILIKKHVISLIVFELVNLFNIRN